MIDSLTPSFDPETGEVRDNDESGGEPAPHEDATLAHALHRMMGVDLTRITTIGATTALTIAAEIGPDFSAFPSAQHFFSWLGLAPGTRISGGKKLPGRGPTVVNKVARSLRMAAVTARRSQDLHRRQTSLASRTLDKAVAVNAPTQELACLIYTTGLRPGCHQRKPTNECRHLNRLRKSCSRATAGVSALEDRCAARGSAKIGDCSHYAGWRPDGRTHLLLVIMRGWPVQSRRRGEFRDPINRGILVTRPAVAAPAATGGSRARRLSLVRRRRRRRLQNAMLVAAVPDCAPLQRAVS